MVSCPQHSDINLQTNITCSWSLFPSRNSESARSYTPFKHWELRLRWVSSPQILATQLEWVILCRSVWRNPLTWTEKTMTKTWLNYGHEAKNKAAFSCSWNVYILDTDVSHDRSSFWTCKLSGIPLKTRQHDEVSGGEPFFCLFVVFFWGGGQDFQSWGLSFSVTTRQICAQAQPQWKSLFVWALSETSPRPPIPQGKRGTSGTNVWAVIRRQ